MNALRLAIGFSGRKGSGNGIICQSKLAVGGYVSCKNRLPGFVRHFDGSLRRDFSGGLRPFILYDVETLAEKRTFDALSIWPNAICSIEFDRNVFLNKHPVQE